MMIMKKWITVFSVVLVLFCFSCGEDDALALAPISQGSIRISDAFPNLGFSRPLDLQSPADGSNRIFVAEQGGVIKVFENTASVAETSIFLDISNTVASTGELGLLGFTFHPDYATNGFVYVMYTPRESLSVLSRFTVSQTDDNTINAASETVLLEIPQPFTNHNGGQLAFGTDGYLYIASGDGGGAGDPEGNAQNLENLLGKILRIDVDREEDGLQYAIPADNPFANSDIARPELFAYGLRNPWRFSIDEPTNTIWAGDVGQGEMEEINRIENGGNYGWNILEGTSCYASTDCEEEGTIAPFYEYNHDAKDKSVTGGYVYRGTAIPSLTGYYVYGDFVSGRIWTLDAQGNNQLVVETGLNIASFGTDANNELYVCSFDGRIYQLTSAD